MDGLNRFDGQQFTRFGVESEESPGLSNSAIDKISVDNEGKFIITFRDFYGYFDRFDPITEEVQQVKLVPSTGVLMYPRTIVTDDFGRTFVVTVGPGGTFVYEYTPNRGEPEQQFTAIYHDPNDVWTTLAPRVELLPLSNGQLLLYDDEYGFRHLSATGELLGRPPFVNSASSRKFYDFAEAPDGAVYLSFRVGYPLYKWTPGSKEDPVPVAGLDAGLRYPKISQDELGQLLLHATEDILGDAFPQEYYLVDTSGRFSFFQKSMPVDRAVTAVAGLNFNETVYLGLREGLGVIERYTNSVQNFFTAEEDDRLSQNTIRGICQDSTGTVYVIEEEGFIYAFPDGNGPPDTLQLIAAIDTTKTITFRGGMGLIYDEKNHSLWATGQPRDRAKGGLLMQFDLERGLTKVFRSRFSLGALAQDTTGRIFLAATDPVRVGLLMEFDEESQLFTVATEVADTIKTIEGFKINDIRLSRSGKLLLATETAGLLSYDTEAKSFQFLSDDRENLQIGNAVEKTYSVVEQGTFWWLGTENGLRGISMSGRGEVRINRRNGLTSNLILGVVPDTLGGLWLSSINGLTYLPPDLNSDNFRRYYREDGLANDEFTVLGYHRDKTGKFFFGGRNGLTVFRAGDFSVAAAGVNVMFTEVAVFGRNKVRRINTNLDQLNQVTIFASEKSVAISFALPAGHLPSSTAFRYQLEGFNDDWVPLTNERTIRFNNLEEGKYILRIQGAGANGNFGDLETLLPINVRQYIYEQFWFQAVVGLAIVFLLFWNLQSKLKERLRIEQLRTQLSSDIHDEVSGLLAGITLQAELLKNRTVDEKMKDKLDKVGMAGRSAMSKMSDVIWSIDSRRDTVGDLLQRMQEHADEVLLSVDIRYEFESQGFDAERKLSGNIRQDLYFIYKEAINNIVRHSNATKVQIELTQAGQIFELYIRDNGRKEANEFISFPGQQGEADPEDSNATYNRVKKEKTGQGRENMRMRAERLKGEITIDDRYGYTLVFRMKRI